MSRVDDAGGVTGVKSVSDFDSHLQRQFHVQRFTCRALAQIRAFEQLHGDEHQTVLLADLINGADVRVVQRRQRPRLALKPCASGASSPNS